MAQSIEVRIVDADTRVPLPYATVVLHGTSRGTITNEEGWFRLPLQGPLDSLRISFIGYEQRVVPLSQALVGTDLRLKRAMHLLGEAVVRPGEDLYVRFVRASNWLRKAPTVNTKLFYGLETHVDDQAVEILNAYFNATFQSAMLRELTFKQGTIGIAAKDGGYFINYNTSAAFVLMDIHEPGTHFPRSPFSFTSAKALRKDHVVERIGTGQGVGGVDHLRATPRDTSAGGFVVELWLDPEKITVRALELQCTNCQPQPFIPLFNSGRLDSVDLRYRQTWSSGARPLPEVMEMEYSMRYFAPQHNERFRTHAIMHAFDHGEQFIPTLFPWKKGLEEYPTIAWMPVDSAFWQRMTPPIPTARQERDRAFIRENDIAKNPWFDSLRVEHSHLRPHYVAWSAERPIDVSMLSGLPPERIRTGLVPRPIKLRTHIYLDLDTADGELQHRSISVFHGRDSYAMHQPENGSMNDVLNIHFDLCEMERRAMEKKLNEPGLTINKARQIHGEHVQRMHDRQERYLNYVQFDKAFLASWTKDLREATGVDREEQLKYLMQGGSPPDIAPLRCPETGSY